MSRMLRAVLAVLAAWVVTGCVSTTTPTPIEGPIPVAVKERFRVMAGEELVGYLHYSEIQDLRYFRVVTPGGIWVGEVHQYGRFYKCEPFRPVPREIGLFPMKEGLANLFETEDPIHILPLDGGAEVTEAAAYDLLHKALTVR